MKKKKYIIISIIIILIIGIYIGINKYNNRNFIKLNYEEILEKINNKDDFILCISASQCSHCLAYKPKLREISNEYNIKIYYTDIDNLTNKEYDEFKERFSFDGSTPTTVFFKEGKEKTTATRIEGDISKEKTIDKLKKNGFIE